METTEIIIETFLTKHHVENNFNKVEFLKEVKDFLNGKIYPPTGEDRDGIKYKIVESERAYIFYDSFTGYLTEFEGHKTPTPTPKGYYKVELTNTAAPYPTYIVKCNGDYTVNWFMSCQQTQRYYNAIHLKDITIEVYTSNQNPLFKLPSYEEINTFKIVSKEELKKMYQEITDKKFKDVLKNYNPKS